MNEDIHFLWARTVADFEAGRLDAAGHGCDRVLAQVPGHALAHSMLSSIFLRQGRCRLATRHAFHASERVVGRPAADVLLVATALMDVTENQLALELLRQVDIDDPRNASSLVALGRQLSPLEDQPAALRCFEKAGALGIHGSGPSHFHGMVLSFTGDVDKAASELERSIAFEQTNAHAHWSLSQLGMKQGRRERIARMDGLLARPDIDATSAAFLHYAMFKEYDLLDETDAAWHALEKGFRARRSLTRYDAVAETKIYDAIIAATGNGFLDAPVDVPAAPTPIFIVGLPRTGTTLLERILGNHPDVSACGELNDFKAQLQWVADRRLPLTLGPDIGALIGRLDYQVLGRRYLEKTRWLTEGRAFFSDKHPMNFALVGPILKALPHAKVINLCRNPMDSCFSNLKELFAPDFYPYSYGLGDLAQHYRNHVRLQRHWQALAPGRVLDVRYEDMVRDPDAQARRVLEFCGLPLVENVADIQNNRKVTTTASTLQVRQPIHQKNVGGWLRYQQPLAPLSAQLQDLMAAY